ncbi:tRNA(Met) cytidine acetyltransferase TmcA [Marinobacter zhanjiangensis]|uniref:tRNA(Met) cytidine acetyltransferase TmcA n=1 Tax=Marinobacter zhanjiangensis TaxID=578215 RepID=A0ABQ3AZV0_9GAMM|nr:GNAT family N-acetyltransferase [Marinobacter zhanjiangensis]GGY71911.1 tRNA(Met) cytidine acetyltransferase TmcA [Marinobacter zhanjiangensis]
MTGNEWQALTKQLASRGERRLVLVEGEHNQVFTCARRILEQLAPAHGLWIGEGERNPNPALQPLPATQARQRLGTETPLVVWDGWQGNPPDALAAMAGTIQAGGLWLWLMPPLAEWANFPDPDYARMGLPASGHHPFMARLADVISDDDAVIRVTAGDTDPRPAFLSAASAHKPFQVAGTPDQERAIEAIVRTGQGRRRRPLVVTADRGRGKSAALGIAAVRLLQGGRNRIAVVSPRKDNVASLFRHAAEQAGMEYHRQTALQIESGATLEWFPVDDLLASRPEAELVMVDEAAAIPAPLLKQVLLGWPRVVFASTVHGYEGSGRGFNLRFRTVLDRETPHWQALTLEQPVRWSPRDPLEPLVNRLFLLDADARGAEPTGDISIEDWQPGQANEAELFRAFGLLVDAHYRTTPGDLRQWMDDPDAVTVVARQGGDIIGVLWATVEGGLDPALAQKVLRGERRLKGHLLPQSLANHGGDAEAATLRMLRVVRVAVHDQCRRQGIGRKLLDCARERASDIALDAIGTSYGAAEELLPFWQSSGFATVRLGISREASSGEYAVQMMKGLSDPGTAAQQRLSARFAEQWPVMLPVVWPTLSPELVLAISADLPPAAALTAQEVTELEAFAYGHRGFELTLPALKRLTVQADVATWLLFSGDAALWARCVAQNQSWDVVREIELCTGRKDGESRIRFLTKRVLFS